MTVHHLKAGVDYVLTGQAQSSEIIEIHHPGGQIDHILLPLDAFSRFGWYALAHDVTLHAHALEVRPKRSWLGTPRDLAPKIRAKARFAAPIRFGGCIYAFQKARKGAPRAHLHDLRGLDLGSEAMGTLLSSAMIPDPLPSLPADTPAQSPPAHTLRVAIVLHLHYPDLWEEFATALARSGLNCRLIVTLTAPNPELTAAIKARFKDASVKICANLGRDIRPFVHLLQTGALDDVDLICKLHGKRSLLSGGQTSRFGHLWRRRNLLDLLGSPAQVARILNAFETRPKLGMMGAAPLRLRNGNGPEPGFEASLPARRKLSAQAGIDPKHITDDLFAGTMFWVRRTALDPLRHIAIPDDLYTPEHSQTGDQFEHALERFFADCTRASGMRLDDIEPLTLSPESPPHTHPKRILAPRALWLGPNASLPHRWAKPLPGGLTDQRIACMATSPDMPEHAHALLKALRQTGYTTLLCMALDDLETVPDTPACALFLRQKGGFDMPLWGAALRTHPALWDARELLFVTDRVKGPTCDAQKAFAPFKATQADAVCAFPDHPLEMLSLQPRALADPEIRAFFETALCWNKHSESAFRYAAKIRPVMEETCALQVTYIPAPCFETLQV